ncbi:MAG: hypothetical protein K2M59_03820 [Muribaculaceae bacterium]|nr:hypothetical protein [Muribaculaceae bacterium]MDE7465538.1 hypothetical protein [Muribaculaceae bacterium]
MTEEEIRKLAEQYGQSVADSFDYDMFADPDFKYKLKAKGEANKAEEVLKWLSEKFCIVEKEKARKLARLTLDNDQKR